MMSLLYARALLRISCDGYEDFFWTTSHALALLFFFFFNDTATTEIYTLSLHDALPISISGVSVPELTAARTKETTAFCIDDIDRKSTRLNSSHQIISYAVFCLKKKKSRIRSRSTGVPLARTFVVL